MGLERDVESTYLPINIWPPGFLEMYLWRRKHIRPEFNDKLLKTNLKRVQFSVNEYRYRWIMSSKCLRKSKLLKKLVKCLYGYHWHIYRQVSDNLKQTNVYLWILFTHLLSIHMCTEHIVYIEHYMQLYIYIYIYIYIYKKIEL